MPERVILAMLARSESIDFASEEWDDDEMPLGRLRARERSAGLAGRHGLRPERGEHLRLVGRRERAHALSAARTAAATSDTLTTGSASVRIIRPPAEAGGAAKLERTPTLTNDSVVELVEAGFSEGTIVRRIEQSPVEFDLSPAKLARAAQAPRRRARHQRHARRDGRGRQGTRATREVSR